MQHCIVSFKNKLQALSCCVCQGITFFFANNTTLNFLHLICSMTTFKKKGIVEGCSHSLWKINMIFYVLTYPGPRWWCYNLKLKGEDLTTPADLADSNVSDIRVWWLLLQNVILML